MIYALCALIGYLAGGLSGGILISRLFGLKDIRREGSGNAGTTNVMRTLGYLPGALTLLFDALKVYLAARVGHLLAGDPGMLTAGLFAVAGHVWPVWFRFRGGKGIAAALGLIAAMSPWMALLLFGIQMLLLVLTRTMSIASLVNIVLFPVTTALLLSGRRYYVLYVITAAAASLLALWAHRANIERLLKHKENRLDFSRIKIGGKRR